MMFHGNNGFDPEYLRNLAWDIGQRRPSDAFAPNANHVALTMVSPRQGFVHWRILHEWIEQTRRERGDAWNHCRMIVRLYDVSCIIFNGLNAHRIQDHGLPSICGQMYFDLPQAGTWQLAEAGFLLRSGEFIPAARSQTAFFARNSVSSRSGQEALLVDDSLRIEPIESLWDQENILRERRKPKLRRTLRIALLSLNSDKPGRPPALPEFIAELAAGLCREGHETHLLAPKSETFDSSRSGNGVRFHVLDVSPHKPPIPKARAFGRAAADRLEKLGPLDLIHVHEWMAGVGPWAGACPTFCSFTSTETTRRNGTPPTSLSRAIEKVERRVAQMADSLLVPGWLREKAVNHLGVASETVHAFTMDGHLANQWDCPLDFGAVKREIQFGPMDRLVLFIGPLEYAAGPDLLLDAMPVLLQRANNLRVAFVGAGDLYGELDRRAQELGVSYAVRLLGHQEGPFVTRLLRAAEALVLPSRYRVPFDDAVVDLARRAGRPVITTHGGPAHLVRHEETGLVTYDNPGSMVWAVDRILGDPAHAQHMGRQGRRNDNYAPNWNEIVHDYLELCIACFPQLTRGPAPVANK